jgi:hypothetical protein
MHEEIKRLHFNNLKIKHLYFLQQKGFTFSNTRRNRLVTRTHLRLPLNQLIIVKNQKFEAIYFKIL